MVNKHKLGMVLGAWMGLMHAMWAVLVWIGAAEALWDWILSLHFLSISFVVMDFNLWVSLLLIVVTSVIGYVAGWIFGAIWNWAAKRQ
jgi:hypothetical protein